MKTSGVWPQEKLKAIDGASAHPAEIDALPMEL
jgi:hypothetical protein